MHMPSSDNTLNEGHRLKIKASEPLCVVALSSVRGYRQHLPTPHWDPEALTYIHACMHACTVTHPHWDLYLPGP